MFHVDKPVDEAEFERIQGKYEGQFQTERPGDPLLTTINFDMCILLLIMERIATGNKQDDFL